MQQTATSSPILYIFSGLPGVGKTTLAKALAPKLSALYIRVDTIEVALKQSSLNIHPAQEAGYLAASKLASENLSLGLSVIVDSVNPLPVSRNWWHQAAKQATASYHDIEVICSDLKEHQTRIETRRSDIKDLELPNWRQVQQRQYISWESTRIQIDTAGRSMTTSLNELLSLLKNKRLQT